MKQIKREYTPGPWMAGPWITERSGSVIWIGPPKNRRDGKVEDIVTYIEIDNEYKADVKIKMEANAKLIAAAPELLDACVKAREMMLKSGINYDNADQYNLLNNVIEKVTA